MLPEEFRRVYASINNLLRSGDDIAAVREDMQGRCQKLLGGTKEWKKYLARPDIRSMWRLRLATTARMTASVAAVEKSDGVHQRKLVQCVPVNTATHSPDGVMGRRAELGLYAGSSVSQVTTRTDVFYAVGLDENNAFSFLETPEDYWEWFAGPAIRARDLPGDWLAASGLARIPGGTWVRPQYCRLPMGFSHAAHLLMVANLFIMRRALDTRIGELPVCSRVVCLSDAETQLERASLDHGEVAYYTHLDDVLTMAGTQEVASALADTFVRRLWKAWVSS